MVFGSKGRMPGWIASSRKDISTQQRQEEKIKGHLRANVYAAERREGSSDPFGCVGFCTRSASRIRSISAQPASLSIRSTTSTN
jgi:hypothetical protein